MQMALAFSILFHLSMVTLFRIVIYFPRQDIDYLNVDIVRTDIVRERFAREQPERLSMPDSDLGFERMTEFSGDLVTDSLARTQSNTAESNSDPWAGLPQIELPKLKFEELDRLRFQVRGLEVGKRYTNQFGQGGDLWSRFGRGLGSVTDALSSVMRGGGESLDGPVSIAVPDPAPGFEAYVEWLTPPYGRQALGGARIESLWGRDPHSLREAIALPFRVNTEGVVTEVLPPLEGDPTIVDDAMASLTGYRFELLDGTEPQSQMGTFVIRGADDW